MCDCISYKNYMLKMFLLFICVPAAEGAYADDIVEERKVTQNNKP